MIHAEASLPFVSVIIPTYNRKESLLRTLDSLARQTYPADRFEVIVVDDGGSDGTEAVAQQSFPFALRYIRQKNQGAAAARNRGAAEARGEIFIFLDDDITVVPGFIGAFQAELTQTAPTVAVGALRPPAWPDKRIFRDLYAQITATGDQPDISFADCLSGIFAVKREDFHRIGAMQDVAGDGRTAWGDVDFGCRAHRLGYRFRRAVDAIGYHDDRAIHDLATYCRVQQKASQQAVLLFSKYPDLQAHIPMFRDKGPIAWRQDPPALILRKLARQVASSRPAMWALEQLAHILEQRYPSPSLLRPLYRWIIGGYIFRGYREGLREYASVRQKKMDNGPQTIDHGR